jgi:glucosamine-6-phosphate deaminase
MEIVIQPDLDRAAWLTSRIVAHELRQNPWLVLGLATGRTMEPVYDYLVELHGEQGLDFSLCRAFNLDEYVGLAPEHPQSYRRFMDEHLFSRVNIDQRNTRVLNGLAADIPAECAAFEREIAEAGGIDVQVLGIGRDGHIGFNEPSSSLRSRTRNKTLTPETVAQNAPLFGDPALMPRHVLTMGIGTILDSKLCVMLITGSEKAEIAAKAIEGPMTAMVPASAMQLHPSCTVILDEAAAVKLRNADYYRWNWENKPEWEKKAFS